MPLITLNDIHKSFGKDAVLEGFSAQFFPGEKTGLIGANGSGKTTLFRMILGTEEPDVGTINSRKNLKIGYLSQEPVFDKTLTVKQIMYEGLAELFGIQNKLHRLSEEMEKTTGRELQDKMAEYDRLTHAFEIAGGYDYEIKINTILAGLTIEKHLLKEKISALSGGQLSRLGLARVLLKETNMLLLDEPTNHLDLQAVIWLEKFLKSYPGAIIVISHDRYLLDSITDKIVEIENKKARTWKGNYTKYIEDKETFRLTMQRQYEKRSELVKRTRDFVDRNINQKGMQGTARGRATRLNKLLKNNEDFLAQQQQERTINFSFAKSESQSKLVLRCDNLAKSFGDLTLFKDMSFDMTAGEKLGITGPNGTGKSTFVKLALDKIKSTHGSIRIGKFMSVGYLDQHAAELNPAHSVLEEARSVKPDMPPEQVRSLLGAFQFTGDDVFKKVAKISGGQQNRLMLSKLVLSQPDVLILDEPTNHLDIQSKEILEKALNKFNGAVIVVSHDRYFLDRVVDKLLVIGVDELGKRNVGTFELVESGKGAYTRYSETVDERNAEVLAKLKSSSGTKKTKRSKDPDNQRKTAPPELKRFNKFTVEQIEEQIMELEEQNEQLQGKFADEDVYKDPTKLANLKEEIETCKAELNLLYQAYELR